MAAFVLPLLVGQFVWLLFYEDDANVLGVFGNADVAEVLDKLQRSLAFCACVTTFVVVAVRFRAASEPRRRALLPSLAGAVALLLFAFVLVNDLITGSRSEALLWIAVASLVAVPAAFLFGLCARGSRAAASRSCCSAWSPSAAASCRPRWRGRWATRGWWWRSGCPASDGYVGVAGEPVTLPGARRRARRGAIERRGRGRGDRLRRLARRRPGARRGRAQRDGIALENQQLHAESEARVAELRASRERLVAAGDAERRRLERNLHDGAQQRLVAIALQLRLLQSRVRGDASAEQLVTTRERRARQLARGAARAGPRHPSRDPRARARRGAGLARLRSPARHGRYETLEPMPPDIALAAYFVASEALANVAKYAQATASPCGCG